eukprot:s2367_g8.t1
MLHVRLASGRLLTSVTLQEICKPQPTARLLKQHLQSHCEEPPFRQRLLGPDGRLIHDDEIFVASVELHLVLLRLLPASDIEATLVLAGRDCAEEVKALLARPQDPNAADDAGDTALHAAALFGAERPSMMGRPGELSRRNASSSRSPKWLARHHTSAAGGKVQSGCKAKRRGNTPVAGGAAGAQRSLKCCSNAEQRPAARIVGGKRVQVMSALLLAAQRGHKDAVRALIGAGADDLPRQDGATALSLATQRDHLHVVLLLLDASADKDKALRDFQAVSRNDWLATPALHFGRWHFNGFEIIAKLCLGVCRSMVPR